MTEDELRTFDGHGNFVVYYPQSLVNAGNFIVDASHPTVDIGYSIGDDDHISPSHRQYA